MLIEAKVLWALSLTQVNAVLAVALNAKMLAQSNGQECNPEHGYSFPYLNHSSFNCWPDVILKAIHL